MNLQNGGGAVVCFSKQTGLCRGEKIPLLLHTHNRRFNLNFSCGHNLFETMGPIADAPPQSDTCVTPPWSCSRESAHGFKAIVSQCGCGCVFVCLFVEGDSNRFSSTQVCESVIERDAPEAVLHSLVCAHQPQELVSDGQPQRLTQHGRDSKKRKSVTRCSSTNAINQPKQQQS